MLKHGSLSQANLQSYKSLIIEALWKNRDTKCFASIVAAIVISYGQKEKHTTRPIAAGLHITEVIGHMHLSPQM